MKDQRQESRDMAAATVRETKRQGDADKAFADEADRLRDRHISDQVRPTDAEQQRSIWQRFREFLRKL